MYAGSDDACKGLSRPVVEDIQARLQFTLEIGVWLFRGQVLDGRDGYFCECLLDGRGNAVGARPLAHCGRFFNLRLQRLCRWFVAAEAQFLGCWLHCDVLRDWAVKVSW